jgi:hypothetical protein
MQGVLEGIGTIAGNFAQGYRQSRAQKTQESLQQQQAQYEHADRLFKMADMVQDPKMKDTLFSSATQILDSLESPTKTKSNPKGIGAMFGSMFGIGHQKPQVATPSAPAPAANPAEPTAPTGTPDSQTYGNLGEMFGSALQRQTPAPETSVGPQIPPVPQVDLSNAPTMKEAQSAVIPFRPPTLTSPAGTPVAPPVAAQPQLPAAPPAAVARHPQSGQPLNIPAPIDIQQQAMKATQSPQYGFRDPVRQKMAEQQYASQIMDTLLKVTDQHLAQNPQIRTLAAADNDPDFGPEFRQVMDAIGRYEAAGQIEKGTLENWQKQRFEDVRFGSEKYNPNPETHTIADAFGNRWMAGPDGKMVPAIPSAATKAEPAKTLEQAADAEWLKPEADRNMAVISSYFDKLSRTDRAKLSPTDQVQWDWLKANEAVPIQKKAETFQGLFHPVQPGSPIILNSRDPISNLTTPNLLNRGTGAVTPIPGAQLPGKTFNAEQYMTEYQGPAVLNAAGRPEAPPKVKVYDPDQLINSHASGDEAVSVDTLRRLIQDPTKFPPGGVDKIKKYIESIPPPYPTLGQKPATGKK